MWWKAIIVVIIFETLDALMDSIDHAKGARTLYELWHIIKFFRDNIWMTYFLHISGIPWFWIILILIVLGIIWEVIYNLGRAFDFWEYDEKLKVPWLCQFFGIKRGN